MRHHEQTEVCAAQVIFQPFSHIKIEMVGRLIQNQQVRLSDKGIGKRTRDCWPEGAARETFLSSTEQTTSIIQ